MRKYWFGLVLCLAMSGVGAQSVDSLSGKVLNFPSRLLGHIQSRTASVNRRLSKQTEKMLREMSRQESRLQKSMARVDPAASKTLFSGVSERYAALARQIHGDTNLHSRSYSGVYLPYLDSLQGSVAFLHQNPQLLNRQGEGLTGSQLAQLQGAKAQLQAFQAKMMDGEQMKAFIQQRKQQISQYISQHANLQSVMAKPLAGMNQQVYYYSQQLREYKEMLNNPDRLTLQALGLLNRLPAFQTFMKDHSMLAGLFRVPGNYGSSQALSGLQTKDQVAQQIQGQVSAGGAAGAAALQAICNRRSPSSMPTKASSTPSAPAMATWICPISNPMTRRQRPSGAGSNTARISRPRATTICSPPSPTSAYRWGIS